MTPPEIEEIRALWFALVLTAWWAIIHVIGGQGQTDNRFRLMWRDVFYISEPWKWAASSDGKGWSVKRILLVPVWHLIQLVALLVSWWIVSVSLAVALAYWLDEFIASGGSERQAFQWLRSIAIVAIFLFLFMVASNVRRLFQSHMNTARTESDRRKLEAYSAAEDGWKHF